MTFGSTLILLGVALFVLLTVAAYTVYAERKIASWIQQRIGPNRVGPMGLLQPLADLVKLLIKEDIIPSAGDKFMHFLAPVISLIIAFSTFAVIPFGAYHSSAPGEGFPLVVADINVGVLFILAFTSIAVYGITLSGWASNSKYSLLGGLRSSAQMISYELSMGLSVVSVVLLTNILGEEGRGYLNLSNVVETQHTWWFVFINPIGFFIFVTCAFAETNRSPFDLVEAEQELVGGFHTEYSSMKFASFFLAEYFNVIVSSMVITTLFLGGYKLPFGLDESIGVTSWGMWPQLFFSIGVFSAKTLFFVFVFLWVRLWESDGKVSSPFPC
jgi:NADH-quinone oxidoreductase subunit H